jgi:hypothetical protein
LESGALESGALESGALESGALEVSEYRRQLEERCAFNEAVISENERDLREIEEQLLLINEIGRELAQLTAEQGEAIARAEVDVRRVDLDIQVAATELSGLVYSRAVLFAILGGVVAGPAGALCGIKSGAVLSGLTIGGSLLGWMAA